ncbi:MAG: hypothetical protein PVJ38_08240 [Candidatus Bathyarchaeota archaeon]|jgi:hypothetical protein
MAAGLGLISVYLSMVYDSARKAARSAQRFSGCPQIMFWGLEGRTSHILLVVPEEKRFWAEYIAEHPASTFGGVEADPVFFDTVFHPLPTIIAPGKLTDTSPCGSFCSSCPVYCDPCTGCPATIHHRS